MVPALRPVTSSPRRLVAIALLAPVLAAVFLAAAGSEPAAMSALWLLLVAVAATSGAAVLATYVPQHGLRAEVGCTPCAAVSAMTVVGAALVLRSYGADLAGPALAIAMTLFGLTQRLGQVDSCTVVAPPSPTSSTRQEG